mgnify:CR=1 FL=1
MHCDIVIPQNNETEFADVALKLGIKKLYFLYELNNFSEEKANKKLESMKEKYNLNFETGIIVKNQDTNKIKINSKLIVAKSSDKDRFLIESKKVKLIYGFEELGRKDYLHQRASGLNHIMCELAKKNNIFIGFSYSSLLNNGANSPVLIGRMVQNIKLCQKYKVKTIISSFAENPFGLRAPHDLSNLFKIFGMDERNVKASFSYNL